MKEQFMRPYRWLIAVFVLVLLAAAAPAQAQVPPRNNIETMLPVREGEEQPFFLPSEEIELIKRLQREPVYPVSITAVSPDDQAVLIQLGERFAFLNIEDGSTIELPLEIFGPFVPLPFLANVSFSWIDGRTLGTVALNLAAERPEDLFVALLIDRITLERSGFPVNLPPNFGLINVSPDLTRYFMVRLPEEALAGKDSVRAATQTVQARMLRQPPGLRSESRPAIPARMQAQLNRALRARPNLLDPIQLMQSDPTDGTVEATARTVDLFTYDARDGRLGYITTVPEATALFNVAWSPNSDKLAFSIFGVADPDRDRPFFDGALLSEEIYRDATGNLPPAENPWIRENNTYVVDTLSGAVQLLRPDATATPPILVPLDWAPDNQTLLIAAWEPARIKGRRYPIYTLQFSEQSSLRFYDTNGMRLLSTLRIDQFSGTAFASLVVEFVSPDEVIFRAAETTNRHPYYYNRRSGELRNLADRAGTYYNVFATNQSREIIFTFTSYTDPFDIYRVGWDGAGLTRLTWFNEEIRATFGLRQDPVSFRLRNGAVRRGVLIQKANAPFPPRNVPIILWQEGGPGPQLRNEWNAIVERPYALLPSFDFALLIVPTAGRAGYNAAAFNALADGNNFGAVDIDELAEITRQAIARGWTSQGKVGITGCSYGGYFAARSIVRYPDLYAAANVQCGLVDLITEWTRGYDALMPFYMGLPPFDNPGEYRADSPIYNVNRIRTPLLTFHGTQDFLPIVQNENMHLQVYNRGVPARMVKFVGEEHGLRDPANQLYAAQEMIRWFRTYLR
jgi:dipeptidyl aminopeptidase/acylaminoacyl peptidase